MKIAVIKKKDDPIALRISIGGDLKDNNYIVYRGDIEKIKLLLSAVAQEFNKMETEPEISDDMGKKYA